MAAISRARIVIGRLPCIRVRHDNAVAAFKAALNLCLH
jgi:hypothetical protein